MELRPYQTAAIEAVEREFQSHASTLIVLATGTGKTVVFSHLAKREVNRGGRVLILAHRGELLEQAIDKLRRATGICAGLEKADIVSDVDDDMPPYTVVVGSVQSMCREKRLKRFRPDEFSLIVIDECHHALTSTYRAVIDYFPGAKLLGVTATPDRGDMRSLAEVFQSIAYEYSIVDAIRDGYLSPIRAQTIPLKIDLSNVATQAGDYQAAGLGDALAPYLKQICREIKERCRDRKTLVFTPLIATSKRMLEALKAEGLENVREVNGESEDRAETTEWFKTAPQGSVVINSMLWTEGFDEPSVDCICVLRPTKVRSLYCQMVGRGTRLSPGKQNLLLLDFLWLTQSHDLCRPASLLTDDEEVAATITEKQVANAGAADMDITPEALEDAASETVKKRENALAKRLEEQRRKKGRLIDPLQYAKDIGSIDLMEKKSENRPTMEQIERLEKLGFGCPDSFEAADSLINIAKTRSEQGKTSAKQIRLLKRFGFKDVENWPFEGAKKLIDRIAVMGWNRLPHGVNPATYHP